MTNVAVTYPDKNAVIMMINIVIMTELLLSCRELGGNSKIPSMSEASLCEGKC